MVFGGMLEAVKQIMEKTEALAAAVAAIEKRLDKNREKDLERREKAMIERDKQEQQKRFAWWF
jgi:hypothetical protein